MTNVQTQDRPEAAPTDSSPSMRRIGVVGLGIMGASMARNLLRKGFDVIVFNRTPERMEPLIRQGAQPAASPADVARRSEAVIVNVTDTPDVEAVLFGPEGIADGAAPGTVVIDMSTISPDATRVMARRLREQGVAMLDAPVTGGDVGARDGTLSIMVGGDQDVFHNCLPVLTALGNRVAHMGPSGMGQTVKLVNQVIVAINLLAMAEGLAFAAKAGVDVGKALDVVQAGAAGSWALNNLAPRVLHGDDAPGFMVQLQQKDLRLALESAATMQLPLPGTAMVQQLLRTVEAYGGEKDGTQALVKTMEKLGNFRMRDAVGLSQDGCHVGYNPSAPAQGEI